MIPFVNGLIFPERTVLAASSPRHLIQPSRSAVSVQKRDIGSSLMTVGVEFVQNRRVIHRRIPRVAAVRGKQSLREVSRIDPGDFQRPGDRSGGVPQIVVHAVMLEAVGRIGRSLGRTAERTYRDVVVEIQIPFARIKTLIIRTAFSPVSKQVGLNMILPLLVRALRILRLGNPVFVVVIIRHESHADLFEIVETAALLRPSPRLIQGREQHRGEDRDDRNYDYDHLLNIQCGVY